MSESESTKRRMGNTRQVMGQNMRLSKVYHDQKQTERIREKSMGRKTSMDAALILECLFVAILQKETKRLVASQGVTIPVCIHVEHVH